VSCRSQQEQLLSRSDIILPSTLSELYKTYEVVENEACVHIGTATTCVWPIVEWCLFVCVCVCVCAYVCECVRPCWSNEIHVSLSSQAY